MKKKLLGIVLTAGLMVSALSGCSLFTTDTAEASSETADPSLAISMTEHYTFENPEDLEFATRYVIYYDENSAMISSGSQYGLTAAYTIAYADSEDAPVGQYDFFICDTAEHAQEVIDLYAAQGTTVTQTEEDPTVLYSVTDGDTLEGTLTMYQSMGVLKDTSVSAYVQYFASNAGGTLQ